MSKEGFDNEDIIRYALNNKFFKELNKNLQQFLIFCCKSVIPGDSKIICTKVGGQNKADLTISVAKYKKFYVSIKMGSGNSLHQEPVDNFVEYLEVKFKLDKKLVCAIKFFIWGDGTYDGTGKKEDRLSARELERNYPQIIQMIKSFFKFHKRELIKRFVILGSKSSMSPDFIYYGTQNNGLWARSEDIINFLCSNKNESKSTIPIGVLTFQAWNRTISERAVSEQKRGVVQIKWPSLKKDMLAIMDQYNS